ncbi:MAG: RDD family protein [Nanoarchaeota archaeon]|nr:RDD family protein [Nanoarchaeota archaeon]MBU1703832.1 RDD family protein [Nanoarchaeota archaeon]
MPRKKLMDVNANIWKRIAAFAADLLIINIVIIFPFQEILSRLLPQGLSMSETQSFVQANPETMSLISAIVVTIGILALFYFTVLESKFGQTVGKMLFKLTIVSDTGKLTFWQCLVRNLFWLLFSPFIFLWIVDPLYMLFNTENRRLTEMLTKTKVVEKVMI